MVHSPLLGLGKKQLLLLATGTVIAYSSFDFSPFLCLYWMEVTGHHTTLISLALVIGLIWFCNLTQP